MIDLDFYFNNGYQRLDGLCVSASEIQEINHHVDDVQNIVHPSLYRHPDSGAITCIKGLHEPKSPAFNSTVRRIGIDRARMASDILGNDELYISQSKINGKPSGSPEHWGWHVDFHTWGPLDSLRSSNMVTLVILLNDISEHHGPLKVIPKSHTMSFSTTKSSTSGYALDVVPQNEVDIAAAANPAVPFTGLAGEAFIMHSRTLHASDKNVAGGDRRLLFYTYNPCINRPRSIENHRNWYQHTFNWDNINTQ